MTISAVVSHVGQSLRCSLPRAAPHKLGAPTRQYSIFTQITLGRGELAVPRALGGGDDKNKKKLLTRETEPDEYWTSERERRGESPFTDPLALIGILAIFFPFIFLGIAIAFGLVDLSGGR